jgi:DNA-binding MarR family transcriptional regulator/GNAT superfamily N-acetyltransferase
MPTAVPGTYVAAVRHFNRFYTRQIGVLQEHLLESPFSLTEVRVLYELAHRENVTAAELRQDLGLDRGYLSRMLKNFEHHGWIRCTPSNDDRRKLLLILTASGQKIFSPLDKRSSAEVGAILSKLSPTQQSNLLAGMRTVENALAPRRDSRFTLRRHRPGDMGWIVQRHGELYWQEYHYDERFEALVSEIVAEFVQTLDPKRERCWIAEKDGERVGSIFLVKKSESIAKLRLLLVEPSARGLGIGKRLVEECIRFARQAGYRKILLWTQSELAAARGIYKAAGFRIVAEEPHDSWSRKNLVAETWELRFPTEHTRLDP